MSRTQRSVINLLGAIYVLAWLALYDTSQGQLIEDAGDDGVFARWRHWGSA